MFNGDKGRLELEVVETSHRIPAKKGGDGEGLVHGEKELPNEGHKKITLQPLWGVAEDVPFEEGTGGHGELPVPSSCGQADEQGEETMLCSTRYSVLARMRRA